MNARTIAAITALGLSTGAAWADDEGQELYAQYCATCHGTDATGGGPMTDILTVPVPDLTQLAARNDGVFPMLDVIHIINGRTGVRAHGGAMPVYGAVFYSEAEEAERYGQEIYARGKILSIAYFLESVQAE
ncbi:c-type cytochrome [Sulfitobacter sabulilitoris]|uniref:Cytochrome c n=1 Tax=Sulfitobacter sabulilitoris TaxID=2562655 RepID=A0A5S3PC51_9RHOB|nr:cytochrome c [Sulfitobacter sabulilitoris]TMM51167.1 cytochrome c [Sulfitobacter sabulilitoris]